MLGFKTIGMAMLCLLAAQWARTDEPIYPGQTWDRIDRPENAGYDSAKLAEAREFSKTIDTAAVLIVVDGQILDAWGEVEKALPLHSMRKSMVSALYGPAVASGKIRLGATLEELGIDDNEPSLTPDEKKATVRDLLMARSGVYHASNYAPDSMEDRLPARGSHAPGTFWYYNNWDFNAVGTIFEQQTGSNLYEAFVDTIANPIGMEHFDPSKHTAVMKGNKSIHGAHTFRMSALDLARFGLLMTREGKWKDRQVIPADWLKESTATYSDAPPRGGYGYMWWTTKDGRLFPGVKLPEGSYAATGLGGHFMIIIPEYKMILVHRVDTHTLISTGKSVGERDAAKLINLILNARLN